MINWLYKSEFVAKKIYSLLKQVKYPCRILQVCTGIIVGNIFSVNRFNIYSESAIPFFGWVSVIFSDAEIDKVKI